MNSFIETLNHWGGLFLTRAWPTLWQSSLLISLLCGIDYLLRNRLRASLRYALWLVVLIKLCLPPTLALPTSPVWWLHRTHVVEAVKPTAENYEITYDTTTKLELPTASLPALVPQKSTMSMAGGSLLVSIAISAGLLVWLTVRWRQIGRKVKGGAVSERLTAMGAEAQKTLGIHQQVPVRMTANSMSPAVCGLFRPTILIPEALATRFSDEQLLAVLLHELIHVRRFDVWMNFWQALLQVAYWWHPLVWLANARIRRVREEAVDDAVMLALRDDAESYPPTLLEVAKLSLSRPLTSLGLVGILESRHSLRERIERLLDFHPPRRAGLTLGSVLGILGFSAIAVPMGGAPADNEATSNPVPAVVSASVQATNSPAFIIESHFYWLSAADFQTVVAKKLEWSWSGDSAWIASQDQFLQFTEQLRSSGIKPFCSPRVQTRNGIAAELYFGNGTNEVDLECIPTIQGSSVKLAVHGENMTTISGAAVTNRFKAQIARAEERGILIQPKLTGDFGGSNLVITVSLQTVPGNTDTWFFQKLPAGAPAVSNSPSVTEILADPDFRAALRQWEETTGSNTLPEPEVTTTIGREQNGINVAQIQHGKDTLGAGLESEQSKEALHENVATNDSSDKLDTRIFKLDPNTLRANWGKQTGSNTILSNIRYEARIAGVNWDSPSGKAIFYNEREGLLLVKAQKKDLDTIEHVIPKLNTVTRQIHIKARFIEVPIETAKALETFLRMTNGTQENLYGILDDQEFRVILHSLENSEAETLAEPEVTTNSRRETQMRATTIINLVAGFTLDNHQTGTNRSLIPKTETVETGPAIDVVPDILPDGYTVKLRTTPSVTVFLGYDKSTNTTYIYTASGDKTEVPTVSPLFTIQESKATANLWDGQTLVLGKFGPPSSEISDHQPVSFLIGTNQIFVSKPAATTPPGKDRQLLVFVTVDIIDQVGNKIHSAQDMPFAKNAIPPQPTR